MWPPSRPVHLHSGSRSALVQLGWRFFGSASIWFWWSTQDDYEMTMSHLHQRYSQSLTYRSHSLFLTKMNSPCLLQGGSLAMILDHPSTGPGGERFAAVFANGPIIDGFHLSEVISFEGILWLICWKIWTSTLKIVIQESTTRWWVFPFFLDIPMKMNMTMERSRNTLGQRPDLT